MPVNEIPENDLTEQDQADLKAGRDLREALDGNLVAAMDCAVRMLIEVAVKVGAAKTTMECSPAEGESGNGWKLTLEKLGTDEDEEPE